MYIKFWGKVKTNSKRGKTLGFPTANVNLSLGSSSKNIPEGIYISKTKVNKKEFKSLTFIGASKTFNEKVYKAETYILDFRQNIYGKWITNTLIKKLRANIKFASAEGLIKQMKQDEVQARKYFTTMDSI